MSAPTFLILIVCFASIAMADDITLSDGKVLHNAKIISQDAASVTIKHSTGIARVMMPELPKELRDKLNYDPDQAQNLLDKEQRATAAMNAQMAAELAKVNVTEAEKKAYQSAFEAWQKSLVTIKGRISQITEDGILLYRENDNHPVFIKHADPGGYVDGDVNSSGTSDLPGLQWILGLRRTRCHRNNSAVAFACY